MAESCWLVKPWPDKKVLSVAESNVFSNLKYRKLSSNKTIKTAAEIDFWVLFPRDPTIIHLIITDEEMATTPKSLQGNWTKDNWETISQIPTDLLVVKNK